MICINANIPKELNDTDDELKAIYYSKNTFSFYISKNKVQRNEFIEKTEGVNTTDREIIYQKHQS